MKKKYQNLWHAGNVTIRGKTIVSKAPIKINNTQNNYQSIDFENINQRSN